LSEIAFHQLMILCQVKLNQIKIHLEINVTESVFHFVLCIYDACDQKEKNLWSTNEA